MIRRPIGRVLPPRVMVRGALLVALGAMLGMDSWAAQNVNAGSTRKKAESTKPATAVQATAWPSRTVDGQPDIQGLWANATHGIYSLNYESLPYLQELGMPPIPFGITSSSGDSGPMDPALLAYFKGTGIVVDPPTGILPFQPWALERRNSVMKNFDRPAPWQIDTQTRGWPDGIPRIHVYSTPDGNTGGPWQVLQPPGYVVFVYEDQHEFRVIPLDGRPQPGQDIKLWMGSSRGHWEGNTLVIETTNHNDSVRFDVVGDFHTDKLKVTERFTYVDRNTLDYRATIEDPRVYTRPWTIALHNKRNPPGTEIFEYAGVEGDKNASIATEDASRRAK